jgi:hypothetical protein
MVERDDDRFGLHPERLAADSADGCAEMSGWRPRRRGSGRRPSTTGHPVCDGFPAHLRQARKSANRHACIP